MTPHPAWITAIDIVLIIPSANLGGRIATPGE